MATNSDMADDLVTKIGSINKDSFDSAESQQKAAQAVLSLYHRLESPYIRWLRRGWEEVSGIDLLCLSWPKANNGNSMQPATDAALGIACDLGLFRKFSDDGKQPLSADQLSKSTGASLDVVSQSPIGNRCQ